MNWFNNLMIKTKLLISFLFVALLVGTIGLVSYLNIEKISQQEDKMYQESSVPIVQLQRITATFGVIRIRIREMFTAKTEKDMMTFSKSIDKQMDSIKVLSGLYSQVFINEKDRQYWGEFYDSYNKYMNQLLHIRSLILEGKKDEALNYMNSATKPLAVLSRNNLDKVVDNNVVSAKAIFEKNKELVSQSKNIILSVMILAILIAIALGVYISKMISKPINMVSQRLESLNNVCLANLQKGAEEFSKGNLEVKLQTGTQKLDVVSKDETGKLSETLNNIIDRTQASVSSVNTVISTVVQLVQEIDKVMESALKGNLSARGNSQNFTGGFVDIIEGLNKTLDAIIYPLNTAADYVDRIGKGDIPEKIKENYNGDFNKIKNNLNSCIDAIDLLIKDTKNLSREALEGNLSIRADITQHHGDFRLIVNGINDTLDAVIKPLNSAAEYIDRISKGAIPEKITENYRGDFNTLKNNLNTCIDAINLLVTDANNLSEAAVKGNLSARADASKHQGDYAKIINGVNNTLDAVINPLSVAAKYVERISKGDMPEIINIEYPGDFNEIKNNLNMCITAVTSLIEDVDNLSSATVNGKLNVRSDTKKHQGDFAKIMEGVNNTLDSVINPLNVAAQHVDSLSKGVIPELIKDEYKDDFNNIKNNLNSLINTFDSFVAAQREMASKHNQGWIDDEISADQFPGIYGQMADSINVLVKSHIAVKMKIVEVVSRYSIGDFSVDMDRLPGKKAMITESIDKVKNSLRKLNEEITDLSQAAVDGNLTKRADFTKYQYSFREMVLGINKILDSVTVPINEGVKVLQLMATGNLTERINSEFKGEHALIKNSINTVANSLNKALEEVSEAVDATASASNQITSSTEEMAAGSQEQTQQTTEVASAVEEMTKTILENTKNATFAAGAAKAAGDKAKEGGKVVSETINGMNKISEVVKKSAETVQELGKSSDQIGEIVQVINDIADQTNLLALNAAIEAARAGEQGRGFAVVADEVRKLAERTTKATKEIAAMIKQIQQDTNNAVVSMEQGTEEVEKGKVLANRAGDSLKEIVSASEKVLDIVAQVAAASEEQSTTAELISKNLEAINTVSQESASGTQQIAKASEDLNRLTLNLENLISRFTLDTQKHGGNIKNKKNELPA